MNNKSGKDQTGTQLGQEATFLLQEGPSYFDYLYRNMRNMLSWDVELLRHRKICP